MKADRAQQRGLMRTNGSFGLTVTFKLCELYLDSVVLS